MWTISYHGNNHYNSIRLPGNPSIPTAHITNVRRFQSYLQQTLDEYQVDLTIISSMPQDQSSNPTTIELLRDSAVQMMSYIALQISNAGGAVIPESHLRSLLSQVEESVKQTSHEVNVLPQFAQIDIPPIENPALAL